MTAPDPRVDEIEAREALVHIKCADCAKCRVAEEECWCPECEYWGCERGPDCEDDPNPTDVAFLLAELRKAHEALEVAFDYGWREGKGIPTPCDTLTGELFHDEAATAKFNPYRAAVAAANGDGNG